MRLPPLLPLAGLAALAGCDGAQKTVPAEAIVARVDCLGMVPTADYENWTSSRIGTPHLLRSDAGVVEGRRCDTYLPPDRIAGMAPGEYTDPPLNLTIHAFGRKWVMTVESRPKLTVERVVGDWYLRGEYETTLWHEDPTTGEVQQADFTGYIDYCDQNQHPECPYTIGGALPYPFEASHPLLNLHGEASLCRAVIDRDNGALQVDVQVAVVNGINIAQLYRTSCPNREDIDPTWYANRLTFQAGGVTGPGDYGPYRVLNVGDVDLPNISWQVPPPMLGQGNRASMLNFYQYCGEQNGGWSFETIPWTGYDAETGVDSQCEWSIEEGSGDAPGRVRIRCTEVRNDWVIPGESPCQTSLGTCTPDCDATRGTCGQPFEFEGACEIVYRGGR